MTFDKITLTKNSLEEIKTMKEFYELVAKKYNIVLQENELFNPTKIFVSGKIFDVLMSLYGEDGAMIMLIYGPKVNETLRDYEVLINQDFITTEN